MNLIDHTFVICAYKESRYLEECIISLKNQNIKSHILLVTSTPNEYIDALCEKYGIQMYINYGESGITQDWEFALSKAETKWVTIAHQDDVYKKEYTKYIWQAINENEDSLIIFTDYEEIRNNNYVNNSLLLKIKRAMLFPLSFKICRSSIAVRRLILSFGNPICCPSVCYNLLMLNQPIFNHHFRSNEDWEAWEKISKYKGKFIYIKRTLMAHRIHNESETSAVINNDERSVEDYEMYKKFWPNHIARLLTRKYKKSEKYNSLE